MDKLTYIHQDYANGKWARLPLTLQMGNIGSEISRALNWQKKAKKKYQDAAIDRALELFDLTIACHANSPSKEKEICRAREEFCEYFFGTNDLEIDKKAMLNYYDQFALMNS
ncbi:hypothetical protein IJG78_03320 [Candidatus Saccharibacteria bacterium]|nr:hypothetical protein [Candidatus Saccharibacteria bacterium]